MRLTAFTLVALIMSFTSYGQFSLTTNTYTQDFDGLGTATNNNVTGGNLYNVNTALDGWYFSESGTNANTTYTKGTGTNTTGDSYNFGTGSTDRSLGGLQSGSLIPTFGFYFTNNTGSSITSLTINYSGETWRVGTASHLDRLDFQYSSNATSLTTGSWTDFNGLDYQNTGSTTTGTTGAAQQVAAVGTTITGLNITNGTTFFIRWTDFDASGSDDGMAINNFSLSTTTSTAPIMNLSVQHPAGNNLSATSVNNIIAIYKLTATNNTINISSTSFVTGGTYTIGTDVTNFKCWQNDIPSIAGGTLVGTNTTVASAATMTFNTGFTSITAGATSYLVITADIASSPALSTVSIIADPVTNFSFTSASAVTKIPASGLLAAGNTFTIASQFQPGKLAVLRVGDGGSLTQRAVPVAIMQFNTSGTGQSGFIASSLPTTSSGANYALTQNIASTTEGEITLSADGNYLTVVGYDAAVGTTGVPASSTGGIVVGRVSVNGSYNTTTRLLKSANFTGSGTTNGNVRSGVTLDGSGFWLAGTSTGSTAGVRYVPLGGTTATVVASNPDNVRIVNIFKNSSNTNQLYVSSASGSYRLASVGFGTPTTSGQTLTNLPGFLTSTGDPHGYILLDRDPTIPGPDLLYVASLSNATLGGLLKYSFDGTTWTSRGSLTGFIRGVIGTVNCNGSVDLYITWGLNTGRPTNISKFTDVAAYNSNITSNGSPVSTAATTLNSSSSPGNNYVFGGSISFTPLPDITITSNTSSAANTYRNITINSGGTFTLTSDITVIGDVIVGNGATLDCGAYHILKNDDFRSTFTLNAGGTLKTADPDGIALTGATGAIQTCGTRTYDIAANYYYTGSGAQITGTGLPATINDFAFTNNSNTSLLNSVQVNGVINIAPAANLNINGKTLTLNGTIADVSAGTITGSNTSNLAITGVGPLSSSIPSSGKLKFDGSVPNGDMVNDLTINRAAAGTATMGSDLVVNNLFTHTAGELEINGFTLTLNKDYTATSGTFTGSASSNLLVAGTAGSLSPFSFTSGYQTLGNFAVTRLNGAPSLGTNLLVNNYISLRNNSTFAINGQTLSVYGQLDNAPAANGTLTGSATSNLVIGGTSGSSAGNLNFTTGAGQNLNLLSLDRTGVIASPAAVLGNALTVNALSFSNGILATGNNLLTWNNTGSLTSPNIPWSANNTSYKSSYLCLCDATGGAISFTQPYDGSVGFKVKNVGGTNTNTWFPVGLDFTSPNRMMINNENGTTQDFSVVLQKGDIGNTPLPSVMRIWHVHATDPSNARATMRLFYTKQVTMDFGSLQDEVEGGFIYDDGHLVQETYSPSSQFVSKSLNGSSDVPTGFIGNSDGTELYASYTYGVSTDIDNNADGIKQFTRFSITNGNSIILPVTIINVKAVLTEDNKINISWTSVNEINVDRYIIERSSSAASFLELGNAKAIGNTLKHDYIFTDVSTLIGNNFYRIKAIDKDGKVIYSNIVLINVTSGKKGITVMPNPVKDYKATLSFSYMSAGKYNIIVHNSNGNVVYKKELIHSVGTATYTLSLPTSLSKAVYFLSIENSISKEVYRKKLTIE